MVTMIGNALKLATACLLLSALVGAPVFAQQSTGVKAQKAQAVPAEPARIGTRKAAAVSPVANPVAPALKLFKHTTSQGKTCCAQCVEIATDGSCKTWSQCSPGVTDCPPWQ